jgi:protein SCO1/2
MFTAGARRYKQAVRFEEIPRWLAGLEFDARIDARQEEGVVMWQVRRQSVPLVRTRVTPRSPLRSLRTLAALAWPLFAAAALLIAGLGAPRARAASDAIEDAHHHRMASEVTRTLASYQVPRVTLVRDDGKSVELADELDDGRPVVLTFIYTSCTTICPLTSMTLADLQERLGSGRDKVHLISISIDPEQDTPARLREYARKFGAGPEWNHYTGTVASSVAVQRAFGTYAGDKMSHRPVTLLRAGPASRWIRIDGFASSEQMLAELQHAGSTQ